jgi:phage terminase large subunit-like protein
VNAREAQEERLALMEEQYLRQSRTMLANVYPDEDTHGINGSFFHARHKYAKHLEFFEAGATFRERCARCANRIGKSFGMGGYESALHVTGRYPAWWKGRRFTKPVSWWAAGKTNETTRDINQAILLGKPESGRTAKGFTGTGLIPHSDIGRVTWKSGVADLADTISIKHQSGGWSQLGLKSYHQGRSAFEGTQQDGIWFDEEPPMDVYGEALIRTATTNGMMMITFTPLEGMSEVVMQFMPADQRLDS